jgi:stage II sporulation protein R
MGILGFASKQIDYGPDNLIRFHVIANSDSEDDQLLKYAVRDEILKKVSSRLARSESIDESRAILRGMTNELLEIADGAVKAWGKDYPVRLEYGIFPFPAKSYGDIILPGGNYEAVEIKIGSAQGANWWCILFPPVCFVNAEEAANLPVDGKEAVPMDAAAKKLDKKIIIKTIKIIKKSDSISKDSLNEGFYSCTTLHISW